MKANELKLRLCRFANNMIDTYYGGQNVGEKMLNYTMKILVKNNVDKLDSVLLMFADNNQEINAESIINDYMVQMGEEKMTFNLQDYVESPLIKSLLPNRALVISAKDIEQIIRG